MGCRPSKLQPSMSTDFGTNRVSERDSKLLRKSSSLPDYSHLEQVAAVGQGLIRIRMVNRNDAYLNDRVQTRRRDGTPKAAIRHEETHTQLIVEFTGADGEVPRKLSDALLAPTEVASDAHITAPRSPRPATAGVSMPSFDDHWRQSVF